MKTLAHFWNDLDNPMSHEEMTVLLNEFYESFPEIPPLSADEARAEIMWDIGGEEDKYSDMENREEKGAWLEAFCNKWDVGDHDCYDSAVPYEFWKDGRRYHGWECGKCKAFIHAG